MLTILSLGAGVQSSTLALMAAKGEIEPMPDCAIFADTGAEPQGVYDYLDWLEKQLPFPVHRVMEKKGLKVGLEESINGNRSASVPFYTESEKSAGGLMRRQCTAEYKITPIRKKIRELLGLKKGERAGKEVRVIQYIGISTDEASRMKPSRDKWIENRHPLIEKRISRFQCMAWIKANKFPIPSKSACTFCPYHNDGLWREMKMNDPKSFSEAVAVDEKIRGGVHGSKQKLYLHRSMKPLAEVDFRNAEDAGQTRLDGFNEECEGMCGL
jgi:hypothetical protein